VDDGELSPGARADVHGDVHHDIHHDIHDDIHDDVHDGVERVSTAPIAAECAAIIPP
jgi:hypothetical protein